MSTIYILKSLLQEVRRLEKKIRNALKSTNFTGLNETLKIDIENQNSTTKPRQSLKPNQKMETVNPKMKKIWKRKLNPIQRPQTDEFDMSKNKPIKEEKNDHKLLKTPKKEKKNSTTSTTDNESLIDQIFEKNEDENHQKEALELKEKGNQKYAEDNFDVAMKFYRKAQKLQPLDARIQANIANCYFHKKKFQECFISSSEILDNKELENKEIKLIKGMTKLTIQSALKLDFDDVALKYAEFASIAFQNEEFERLLTQCKKKIKQRKKKKKEKPPS